MKLFKYYKFVDEGFTNLLSVEGYEPSWITFYRKYQMGKPNGGHLIIRIPFTKRIQNFISPETYLEHVGTCQLILSLMWRRVCGDGPWTFAKILMYVPLDKGIRVGLTKEVQCDLGISS